MRAIDIDVCRLGKKERDHLSIISTHHVRFKMQLLLQIKLSARSSAEVIPSRSASEYFEHYVTH